MTWLIDLGNTRLKCARLLLTREREPTYAFVHRGGRETEADAIARLLDRIGIPSPEGTDVLLASVAPRRLTDTLVEAVRARGFKLRSAQSAAQFGKLRIAYAEPTHLGVDRFLALLAASERTDGPWLVVSIGSAVTVDLLGADGKHFGGLIAPSPEHMREALASRFAALDLPEGVAGDFARDSADAVASGIRGAALGLLERSAHAAEALLGMSPTLLATGGGASLLEGWRRTALVPAPDLVLEGLAIFAQATEN
jgi:type III pantothenate kinase